MSTKLANHRNKVDEKVSIIFDGARFPKVIFIAKKHHQVKNKGQGRFITKTPRL